jgi:hypothetical protein
MLSCYCHCLLESQVCYMLTTDMDIGGTMNNTPGRFTNRAAIFILFVTENLSVQLYKILRTASSNIFQLLI